MSASLLASVALPRPPALTTVVFEDVHEEGREGLYGRSYVMTSCHPYRFASRAAAGRFANAMCDRCGYDGYRLSTPGFAPPPQPVFDDSEIPF
ncbi:MAG: hypothetical protein E7K72_00590 [Roseomonas mucosa]|nr:hypothetical protein [Roseomonas mucosa]